MSIFNGSNPRAFETIKHLIDITTMIISPALKASWERPPPKLNPESSSGSSTEPSQHSVHDIHMSLDMRATLERLYDELRSADGTLPKDRFVAFLKDVQAELSVDLDKEVFDLGAFFYVLTHICPLDAVKPLPKKDLSKPINNYFISSHDTCFDGNNPSATRSPEPEARKMKEARHKRAPSRYSGDDAEDI